MCLLIPLYALNKALLNGVIIDILEALISASSNIVVHSQQRTTTSCYSSVLEALISASSNSVVGIHHVNQIHIQSVY